MSPQSKSFIRLIEERLGAIIEQVLQERAVELASISVERFVDQLKEHRAIKMFLIKEATTPEQQQLVVDYIHTQIFLAQSVNLERDVLTLSQYVRQFYDIDTAISLLEHIHEDEFKLGSVFKAPNELPSHIAKIIKQLQAFYCNYAIKKEVYENAKLTEDAVYKTMQESKMWIDGQRKVCILGMQSVKGNTLPVTDLHNTDSPIEASLLFAAKKHIEISIGLHVDGLLSQMHEMIAYTPVESVLQQLMDDSLVKNFFSSLNNTTRAGFSTYFSSHQMNVQQLKDLIQDFLQTRIHLAQSIMLERNIVRISQAIREYYGIDTSINCLETLADTNFSVSHFFGEECPPQDLSTLIEGLHKFYELAKAKKESEFFDVDDDSAKKLLESEMWLNLQRRCCIQGMRLIKQGNVYQGQGIDFNNLVQPGALKQESLSQAVNSPSNGVLTSENSNSLSSSSASTASSLVSRPQYEPYSFQDIDEQAALKEAIRRSQMQIDPNNNSVGLIEDTAEMEALTRSVQSHNASSHNTQDPNSSTQGPIVGLGYPGSENLMRTPNGIESSSSARFKLFGLANYPVRVNFTKKGLQKMDAEYREGGNASTIDIKARLSTGQEYNVFSINTNFFGRVQADRNSENEVNSYDVNTFLYDSSDNSFESVFGSERSFSISNRPESNGSEYIDCFKAIYLLGYICADEQHSFILKYITDPGFSEKLVLNIDVDDNDQWQLECQQKRLAR